MTIRRAAFPGVLLLLALSLTWPVFADTTTGAMQGRTTGPDGGPLGGVRVELSGPALQGAKTTTSDASGLYHVTFLLPGKYDVKFSVSGFETVERKGVPVSLGATANVDVTMQVTVSEAVSVTAGAPLIDRSSTRVGENFDETALTTLPTARSYASVAQVVPGASNDEADGRGTGLTIYGSSGSENAYFIDGVNTTNAEYGTQGKELNFEFIQEVEVKTGGYEAEYGRSTGGIINVITKSGGNEFHGDLFGYRDNDSLQSSNKHPDETNAGQTSGYTREDYGLDLGGYFLPDRLWFFGAYDRVKNQKDTPVTTDVTRDYTAEQRRNLSAAKLTLRLTDFVSLIGSYIGDPTVDSGVILDAQHGTNGDPSTFLGRNDTGGHDYSLRAEAILSISWLASFQVSRHEENRRIGPSTPEGEEIQYLDNSSDGFATGGFGFESKKRFTRDFFGASVQSFWGDHSLKAGLEFQKDKAKVLKTFSGGQQVTIFDQDPGDGIPAVYEHFYWTTPDATLGNAPTSSLIANPKHQTTTIYLQDKWSVTPSLTLSAGVRWDHQEIKDYSGATVIDLKKNYAPRLGVIWVPEFDPGSRAYASYGIYYEEIPMDLVIRSFSFERQPHIYNFDPVGTTPDPAAEAIVGSTSNILGQPYSERTDQDLRGQSLEEYVVGYDKELSPGFRVGAKYIYRRYREVIEDFLCDPASGEYCIGNPGRGIMKAIYNENYDSFAYTAPKAQRQFHGFQIDAEKRFEGGRFMASYIYSRLRGNYDGEYAPFTNVGPDPNISAAYDYYEFTINNRGDLSNDRRHQFKLSGTYTFPFQLEVGTAAYYRTGTPVTRYGFDDGYGRYEHFLTTRGAEGRTPDTYEIALHLGYPVAAGPVTVRALVDVFNLLNAQKATVLDQRWDFASADNESRYPANRNYGKALKRQEPRSVRVGLRISY